MNNLDNTIRDQFMRIAMARLKSIYRFYPQRLAVSARMFTEYQERLKSKHVTRS
jgi:hypothetical protein